MLRAVSIALARRATTASTATTTAVSARGYARRNDKAPEAVLEANGLKRLPVKEDMAAYQEKLKLSVELLSKDLQEIRVNGAMTNILDKVTVKTGDKTVSLVSISQIAVKDPQNLTVAAFDPSQLELIASSIRAAGLNLNPVVDKTIVRVPIPKVTQELREKLTKVAKQASEKARGAIRTTRQNMMKSVKGYEVVMGKDEAKKVEKEIEKHTEASNKEIDAMLEKKNKEILGK